MPNNTVPISSIIEITPSVLAAAGKAIDLNGMVLSTSPELPANDPQSFPSSLAVANYFGPSSREATIASQYFKGPIGATILPGALMFYRFAPQALAAFVKGADISALAITDLQQITGTLIVNIDGTEYTTASLDLSDADSFTDAAATIQTALGATDTSFTAGIAPSTTTARSQIVGNTLTASAGAVIFIGTQVTGGGVAAGTVIDGFLTGNGGAGKYTVNIKQQVAGPAMLTYTNGLMTVSAMTGGNIDVGDQIGGTLVDPTTVVVGEGNGTGQAGTYYVTPPQTVASGTAMTTDEATVVFDSVAGGFVITAGSVGSNSTVSAVTGTAAAQLGLSAGAGAVLSQGQDATNRTATMDNLANNNQNWASFMATAQQTPDGDLQFAEWCDAQNQRYLYVQWNDDIAPTISPDVESAGALIQAENLSGTTLNYAIQTPGGALNPVVTAAAILSYGASLDFSRTNGRKDAAFRQFSGVAASVRDQSVATILNGDLYNYFQAVGSGNQTNTFYYKGQVTGPFRFMDSYVSQIWLNNSMAVALLAFMLGAGYVPYNQAGYRRIAAALQPSIAAAVNFGMINAGVTLDSDQIQQLITDAGLDISGALFNSGYYLQILDPGTAVRQQRGSPLITLFYVDGGSVQSINMASIAIQ